MNINIDFKRIEVDDIILCFRTEYKNKIFATNVTKKNPDAQIICKSHNVSVGSSITALPINNIIPAN